MVNFNSGARDKALRPRPFLNGCSGTYRPDRRFKQNILRKIDQSQKNIRKIKFRKICNELLGEQLVRP